MAKIAVRPVESAVLARFAQHIDVSDIASAPSDQLLMQQKTRCLAAFALTDAVDGLADAEAARHVTDGSRDCGIDALLVSNTNKTIYVVQSKWHDKGTGSIGLGDARNTIAGLRYLTDLQFEKFNKKFAHILPSVQGALDDIDFGIELIVVTTGDAELSDEVDEAFQEIVTEINDISEYLKIRTIGLREIRAILTKGAEGPRIDIDINLASWGSVTEPFTAFYGLVDGATLASWYSNYGGKLFDQNLRKALGTTSTNSAIVETASSRPDQFWYFNNGVTALCERLNKTPQGGSTRLTGNFKAEGLSIVNGAQTVSSLASAMRTSPEEVEQTLVWVRLISLENAPEDFASEVTKATNTQNSVEARDFIALDPKQEALSQDFLLTLTKSYVYRRGEASPQPEEGVGIQEALVALACAHVDPSLAVLAKSNIGRLEDAEGRYYPQLFNDAVSAHVVWNAVNVYRAVETALSDYRKSVDGRDLAIALQGNRIITHLVFQLLGGRSVLLLDEPESLDGLVARVDQLTRDATDELIHRVNESFAQNYVTSLFKNASRCEQLVRETLAALS